MAQDISTEIKACTLALLINNPFFGFIVSKMRFIESSKSPFGDTINTAATDGKNIIYNTDFFLKLDPKERTFVIAHEVLHCVLDTLGRLGDRDMGYWNMATDFVINGTLKKENIGTMPKVGLYDPKYDGWIAEQVYEDLKKNKAAKKEPMDVHLDPNSLPKEKGEKGKASSTGQQPGDKEKGEGSGDGDQDDEGQGHKISHKEIEKNMKEMRNTIVEAYQRAKMAGHDLGGMELLIDGLINPRINWKQLLNATIQSIFKDDITWNRPNRRNPVTGMILPTLGYQDTVDICISIDTSGSISDEQRREFLSEIAGILNYYKNFKLKLWCFDTGVHAFQEYDTHNINDLVNYVPGGGGGTDIGCNFEFMDNEDIKPKQFICLTDGYNGSANWGPEDYCPTVWIIHSNPKPQVPWGRYAIFEELVNN
jgi:predicted metal-dependent peptidase